MSQSRVILIAASGTGGHLFPALVVAEELRDRGQTVEFVGSGRPLESKLVEPKKFSRHVIPAEPIMNHGILGFIRFTLALPVALIQAIVLLRKRNVSLLIGFGGYASFVPALAAWLLRIPVWLHEAERELGLANRKLLPLARRISLAYPSSQPIEKAILSGQPIRNDLQNVQPIPTDHRPVNLLILGGSQGARSLDLSLPMLSETIRDHGLHIRHQARPENCEVTRAAYAKAGLANVEVVSFIDDMAAAYSWADVIVARAGAGAVTEIGAVGRPALFVPFPAAADNHQLANAQMLESAGKAIIVEEGEDFEARLEEALEKLLANYLTFAEREYQSNALTAASTIADGCLALTS